VRGGSPFYNDISDISTTTVLSAATGNIGYTIQHPDIRVLDPSSGKTDWHMDYRINALWGNGDGVTRNLKTVYDPSPAGYCVPDYDCFSGLAFTSATECDENYGMNFVVDGSNTSFYPTSGYYDGKTNRLYYAEYRGYIWTSSAGGTGVWYLYYNRDGVKKLGQNRALGSPTRCVKLEE
jgi:hypothetical protein